MRTLRRICIGLVAAGVALLLVRPNVVFDTVPFPATGLTVKMLAEIRTEGDYRLVASMPKIDQTIGLGEEAVTCLLTVRFTAAGRPPISSDITSLSRHSEFGFAGIQYYKGGEWHLKPGEYEVEIHNRQDCQAALARGAALTLEQQASHITERVIASELRHLSSIVFLCAGFLGLFICEVKGRTP